jgi:hypothetical protein
MIGYLGPNGSVAGVFTRAGDVAQQPPPNPPGPPNPSPPPPPPGDGATVAKVTDAKARCRRVRKGKPCRVVITFGVDRPVTVKVTVRKRVGRKKKKLGSLRRAVQPPAARIVLPKRLRGHRIGRGRYVIVIAVPGADPVRVNARVRG